MDSNKNNENFYLIYGAIDEDIEFTKTDIVGKMTGYSFDFDAGFLSMMFS